MGQLIQRADARIGALMALVAIGFTFGVPRDADAQLNITLSGTPGSSIITANFSGSATATSSYFGGLSGIGWSFAPTTVDPFPPPITGADFGQFDFISGSASITIDGTPQAMTGVFLQDSSNSPIAGKERFGTGGFEYTNISPGEPFQWSGTVTFDISGKGLTFGNLNAGTTGAIPMDLGGIAGSLTVVPEPSTFAAIFVCGLALLPRVGSARTGKLFGGGAARSTINGEAGGLSQIE